VLKKPVLHQMGRISSTMRTSRRLLIAVRKRLWDWKKDVRFSGALSCMNHRIEKIARK